jgi:diacylglycerol kinase family enzyme
VKNLFKSNPDKLVFHIDGTKYDGHHAIIGNVSRYGGNFRVTPNASIESTELYICIFEGGKRIDLAKYAFGVVVGRHHTFKDVVYLKCNKIIVDGSAHIQIDGNYFGKSPVKIDAIQNALSLIY